MTDLQNPTGEAITSITAPENPNPPATAPTMAPASATVISPEVKETFLQKLKHDAAEAWQWLEKEIHKI